MGFTEALTLIFIILKLTDTIDWTWVWVLSPEIFALGCYAVLILVSLFVYTFHKK